MILVADWLEGRDPSTEPPSLIHWADGSVATLADFARNFHHTNMMIVRPDGSLQQIFLPDFSGSAFYDTAERVWRVRPEGETIQLSLEDPFASDDDIIAEIFTFPIVYRSKINRAKLTETAH
jgi:hypothetical protein